MYLPDKDSQEMLALDLKQRRLIYKALRAYVTITNFDTNEERDVYVSTLTKFSTKDIRGNVRMPSR